jgi:hypothetical protein
VSKWSSRDGILTRHVGHALLGIDSRSVVCTDCGLTLLLDANREVRYDPPADERAPRPAESSGPDAYGRRPCPRCGKRVTHDSDGDPHAHAVLGDPVGRPCVRAAEKPATLPPGGWRSLVAAQQSETSP